MADTVYDYDSGEDAFVPAVETRARAASGPRLVLRPAPARPPPLSLDDAEALLDAKFARGERYLSAVDRLDCHRALLATVPRAPAGERVLARWLTVCHKNLVYNTYPVELSRLAAAVPAEREAAARPARKKRKIAK